MNKALQNGDKTGPFRVVAVGDSITAGTPGFKGALEAPPYGVGNKESQYHYWLGRAHPDWKVYNYGVNSQRTDQILKRIDQVILADPHITVILAGTNDVMQRRKVKDIIHNLDLIYLALNKIDTSIVACTIPPIGPAPEDKQKLIEPVNTWIKNVAIKRGYIFCDIHKAARDPQSPQRLFGSQDGLHPDIATYRLMGEALNQAISKSMNLKR